jgi:hypothetical protein
VGWVLWAGVPTGLYAGEKLRVSCRKKILKHTRESVAIEVVRARQLLFEAYKKAAAEYWTEAIIELNTMAIQPGKAFMMVVRGVVEIGSYLNGQDTSTWTVGGRAERVAAVLPLMMDAFACYMLLPNIYNINALFNFTIFIWATFNVCFLWVDEFFQPLFPQSFKNVKLQKFLKGLIYYMHIVAWFYAAGLVSGSNFWGS